MPTLNKLSNLNFNLILSTRRKLVIAGALIFTSLVLLVLTYSQVTAIFQTQSKIATTQKKVDQLKKRTEELQQLKYTDEYAQAERMSEILPSHKPLLELLNNLNSVANETRVSITEFKINPGEIVSEADQEANKKVAPIKQKRSADYDQLELELSVVGELNQVKEFMTMIERVSPITTITSLSIDRESKSVLSGDQMTRADITLNTYYYTKPVSATLASALPKITDEEKIIFQDILKFTPPKIEDQTEIIGGDNTDLFGIEGLAVSDLEKQISTDVNFSQ